MLYILLYGILFTVVVQITVYRRIMSESVRSRVPDDDVEGAERGGGDAASRRVDGIDGQSYS